MSQETVIQLIITGGGILIAWFAMRQQMAKDDRDASLMLEKVKNEAESAVYSRLKEELDKASARASAAQDALDQLRKLFYESERSRLDLEATVSRLTARVNDLEEENKSLRLENKSLREGKGGGAIPGGREPSS